MIDPRLFDRIPALQGLDASKAELAEVAREVRYPQETVIYPMMAASQNLVMLLEGLAKMSAVAVSGIQRIVYVYRPGEILGSRILLQGSPESAYQVSAMLPVRALIVSKANFLSVGDRHPDLLLAVTEEFSRRLETITAQVLSAMTSEVPARLCRMLLEYVDRTAEDEDGFVPLRHRLTHETMAQIIGASRPHTSTVLGDLEQSGAVRRRSARRLLVHPGRLLEIVAGESGIAPGRSRDAAV